MTTTLRRVLASVLLCAATYAPAQDWATKRLDASPRHHEYVTLQANGKPLQAFVVYPEVKNKATAVVLIHEIFGLSAWAKSMADDLAAAGYVVIAPDLLTGMGPNGGGVNTDDELRTALAQDFGPMTAQETGKSVDELVDELMYLYPNIQAVGIPGLDKFPVILPGDAVATAGGLQYRRTGALFGD